MLNPTCDPPGENFTTIHIEKCDLKILEIQLKEGEIKILLQEVLSWLDHRIEINPSNGRVTKSDTHRNENTCLYWHPNMTEEANVVVETGQMHDRYNYEIFKAGEKIRIGGIDRNTTRIIKGQERTLRFSCDLSVDEFPFDVHECKLMELNADKRSLKLLVRSECNKNRIRTSYKDGFKITLTWHEGIVNGQSSHVKFDLKFIRILSPVVFQYYLPCNAIVVISQISFILPPSSVPGRIGLLATLFLTLTNLFINHMVSNCEGKNH